MKIVVTGSLGNISRPLAAQLIAHGHAVHVISSDPEKTEAIRQIGAMPHIGSLQDRTFVLETFAGADAVYTMVPPDFSVADYYEFSDTIHQIYADAITQHSIRYVVNLSSIGVTRSGEPPLARYYHLEKRLDGLRDIHVIHLRPAMFYTNFYGSMEAIKHFGRIGHNVNGDQLLVMTHPHDIADAAFRWLNAGDFRGRTLQYVISDVRTGNEVATILGEVLGVTITWEKLRDDQLLETLIKIGFSRDAAETAIIGVGQALNAGLFDEFTKPGYRFPNGRPFTEFAKDYAVVYQHA